MTRIMSSAILLLLAVQGNGYVSQTQEQDLKEGETVWMIVNSMTSEKALLPLGYYSRGLFPEPNEIQTTFSMGMLLSGEKKQTSKYFSTVLKDNGCQSVGSVTLDKNHLQDFEKLIEEQYRSQVLLQDMYSISDRGDPLSDCYSDHSHAKGYPIGCKRDDAYFINNHVDFLVEYNIHNETKPDPENLKKIFVVGLKARAKSGMSMCKNAAADTFLDANSTSKTIEFTYTVTWKLQSQVKWSNRWNAYIKELFNDSLDKTDERDSIINSIFLIVCLTVVVALILMRALHLDFNRYNNPDNEEELQEEVGWKLIHGDVFRPPVRPNLFAVIVGTGAQLCGMVFLIISVSFFGLISPDSEVNIVIYVISLFALFAFLNGYVVGRLQTTISQKEWKVPIISALLFPGLVFALWSITEIALSANRAANAVGIRSVLRLLLVWWGLSAPLAVLGASVAYKKEAIKPPIPPRKVVRVIPKVSYLFSTPALIFIPGIISFVVALVELKLIFGALWQGRVLHMFSFLFATSILLAIVTAELTIVVIYYLLVYEDHRWWWSSLIIPSGTGVYAFLFSIRYMSNELDLDTLLAHWIYLSFTFVLSLSIILMCGFIGFYAAWTFTTKIYTAIKIE